MGASGTAVRRTEINRAPTRPLGGPSLPGISHAIAPSTRRSKLRVGEFSEHGSTSPRLRWLTASRRRSRACSGKRRRYAASETDVGAPSRSQSEATCVATLSPRRGGTAFPSLELLVAAGAADDVVVGERHQPLQLGGAQSPVVPVERADPWPWLPLDRRGGSVGMKLEQEAPIPGAPLESRLRMAAPGGQEQVVVARRYRSVSASAYVPVHHFFRFRRVVFRRCPPAHPAVTCGDNVSSQSARRLMRAGVGGCRPGKFPALRLAIEKIGTNANAEQPLAELRHTVVGSEDDPAVERVPGSTHAGDEALEDGPVVVVVRAGRRRSPSRRPSAGQRGALRHSCRGGMPWDPLQPSCMRASTPTSRRVCTVARRGRDPPRQPSDLPPRGGGCVLEGDDVGKECVR